MLPELKTDRLIIRETQLDDGPELQAYQNCSAHWEGQAMEPANFADGSLRVQRYLEYRGSGDERRLYDFVARKPSGGALVGQVSLERFHPRIASIGFSVAELHRGQGYATEMAKAAMAFGFDTLGLHRIAANVAIENEASQKVVEKIGMIHEGTARDCIWAQGRWWTEMTYALLTTDRR